MFTGSFAVGTVLGWIEQEALEYRQSVHQILKSSQPKVHQTRVPLVTIRGQLRNHRPRAVPVQIVLGIVLEF